jgi:hypothetical protein
MISVGIVVEGITDYEVISNILYGFFDEDEPMIKPIQPVFDEDQKAKKGYSAQNSEEFGGWVNVIDYCKHQERLAKDMQGIDYLVIQIDTDTSEEIGFDVSKIENNKELTATELYNNVIEKLQNCIIQAYSSDFFNFYAEKIIFAIAIHSTECWLLPLYATQKADIQATKNCHARLKKILKRKINKKEKVYDELSKPLMKNRELQKIKDKNPSLKIFIENLEKQIVR